MIISVRGLPNILKTDHGSGFTSKDWRRWTSMAQISLETSRIEPHSSNGVIERHHDLLQ